MLMMVMMMMMMMMMNDDTTLHKDSTKAYLKNRGENCGRSENVQNYKVPSYPSPSVNCQLVKYWLSPKAEWFRKDGETNLPNSQKSHCGNGPLAKMDLHFGGFCWEMVTFAICNEECTGLCRGFPSGRKLLKVDHLFRGFPLKKNKQKALRDQLK